MNSTIEKNKEKIQNDSKVNEQTNEKKVRKIVIKVLVTLILIIILLILLSIILREDLLHLGGGVHNNTINNTINGTGDNNGNNGNNGNIGHNGNIGNNGNIGSNTVKPPHTDIEDNYVPNYLFVISEGNQWGAEKDINVFNNEFYSDNIIAPGVSGKYNFTVENTRNNSITYNLDLQEINLSNINLQYKVKINDVYIIDNWTRIEDISLESFELYPYAKANYTLEWQWIDAENDTSVGSDAENIIYKIKIKINSQTT